MRIGLFICEANELPLQTGNSVGAVLGIFGKGSRKDRIFISPWAQISKEYFNTGKFLYSWY